MSARKLARDKSISISDSRFCDLSQAIETPGGVSYYLVLFRASSARFSSPVSRQDHLTKEVNSDPGDVVTAIGVFPT